MSNFHYCQLMETLDSLLEQTTDVVIREQINRVIECLSSDVIGVQEAQAHVDRIAQMYQLRI